MTPAQLAAQAAWIAADVAKVDRAVTPWVVAFSHKAWQMDSTTWSLFDWMTPAGVDFHFVGHWHQYTRYPPIDSRGGKVVSDFACMSADNSTYTNPKYPTLIVTGAPGDIEVNPDHCQEPYQIQNLCSGNYGVSERASERAARANPGWTAPRLRDHVCTHRPCRTLPASLALFAICTHIIVWLLQGLERLRRHVVLEHHRARQGHQQPNLLGQPDNRQDGGVKWKWRSGFARGQGRVGGLL